MSNMRNIITKHNNKSLFQSLELPTRMCNCIDKASCPMDGKLSPKVFRVSGTSRQRRFKKVLPWDV